ncbi:MAG: GFA family protein [Alphaproteobacteria bacterium]
MVEKKSRVHRGGCQCGAVRYEVGGTPIVVAHCHCENCQRGSGAGHSTGAMFAADGFTQSGPVGEYKYQSKNGNEVTRAFCPTCGSPLFGRNTGMDGFVTITLGSFDDSSDFKPEVAVFARNRKPWDVMDGDLLTFDTQPGWKPGDG